MDKKIEELLNTVKLNALIHPAKDEETKKDNPYVVALVIVGAVALIAYAVYYFFVPDKLVDFEDDFDDVYGDEIFDEHEAEAEKEEKENAAN